MTDTRTRSETPLLELWLKSEPRVRVVKKSAWTKKSTPPAVQK